jgi:hypothetical protein
VGHLIGVIFFCSFFWDFLIFVEIYRDFLNFLYIQASSPSSGLSCSTSRSSRTADRSSCWPCSRVTRRLKIKDFFN